MIIVMVGVLIFWAGWAAFSGARMTMRGASLRTRCGGGALTLVGVSGVLYGMRLLVS
jgi:hypothetical protein